MNRTIVEPQPAAPVFVAGQGGLVETSIKSMKVTWGNMFALVFKFWVVCNIYFGLAVLFWFVLISALLEG